MKLNKRSLFHFSTLSPILCIHRTRNVWCWMLIYLISIWNKLFFNLLHFRFFLLLCFIQFEDCSDPTLDSESTFCDVSIRSNFLLLRVNIRSDFAFLSMLWICLKFFHWNANQFVLRNSEREIKLFQGAHSPSLSPRWTHLKTRYMNRKWIE